MMPIIFSFWSCDLYTMPGSSPPPPPRQGPSNQCPHPPLPAPPPRLLPLLPHPPLRLLALLPLALDPPHHPIRKYQLGKCYKE